MCIISKTFVPKEKSAGGVATFQGDRLNKATHGGEIPRRGAPALRLKGVTGTAGVWLGGEQGGGSSERSKHGQHSGGRSTYSSKKGGVQFGREEVTSRAPGDVRRGSHYRYGGGRSSRTVVPSNHSTSILHLAFR